MGEPFIHLAAVQKTYRTRGAPLLAVSEATYFQTRTFQDYEAQSAVLKGIGETQIHVAALGGEGPVPGV